MDKLPRLLSAGVLVLSFVLRIQAQTWIDSLPAAPNWTPLEPGEHPRLFFRASDIPTIRDRAENTPEGRQMVAKLREMLARDTCENSDFPSVFCWHCCSAPYVEGQWAAGHAFLACIFGDAAEAERAKEVAAYTMTQHQGEWGCWGCNLRWAGVAVAYDLCYHMWDDAFKAQVLEYFTGPHVRLTAPYGHTDRHPDCMFQSARSIVMLSMVGDPGAGDIMPILAYQSGKIRQYLKASAGDRGFVAEQQNYTDHQHVLLPFAQAFRNVLGRDYLSGVGETIQWIIPLAMFSRGQYWGCDWGHSFWRCLGFKDLVPEEYVAAYKWYMREYRELDNNRERTIQTFGATLPWHYIFAMVNYPWDTEAVAPQDAGLPLILEDTKLGGFVCRSGWNDATDFGITVTLMRWGSESASSVTAGDFTVHGFSEDAERWMGRTRGGGGCYTMCRALEGDGQPSVATIDSTFPRGGAELVYRSLGADGSAIITMDKNGWFMGEEWRWKVEGYPNTQGYKMIDESDQGITVRRSLAIDYSGASGAPCLVVVVDKVTGAPEQRVGIQYNMAGWRSSQWSSSPDGRAWTFGRTQYWRNPFTPSSLRLTLMHPDTALRDTLRGGFGGPLTLMAKGGNEYFTIITLQDSTTPTPEPAIVSGKGLDARIAVGNQEVSFDGEKIVLAVFEPLDARPPLTPSVRPHDTPSADWALYDIMGRRIVSREGGSSPAAQALRSCNPLPSGVYLQHSVGLRDRRRVRRIAVR